MGKKRLGADTSVSLTLHTPAARARNRDGYSVVIAQLEM
jgi:hypothetical protein